MKKKLDTYKVLFDATQPGGVVGISLVKSPAIKSAFIALSEQEEPAARIIQLKEMNAEERILLGAVLVPDMPIYRKGEDGEDFYITFPEETIKLAAESFYKNDHHKNSTLEHKEALTLSGVTFVESWIKKDAVHDKSAMYGLEEPVGTWYVAMKVDNDEVWEDFVKTGTVTGFSIDGLFDLEQINLNENTEMKRPEFLQKFIDKAKNVLSLGETKTEDGEVTFNFDGDEIVEGETAITMDGAENGEDGKPVQIPVPDGDYKTELGTITVKDSVVSKVTKAEDKTDDEAVDLSTATPAAPATPATPGAVKSERTTKETVYALAEAMADVVDKRLEAFEGRIETKLAEHTKTAVSLTDNKGEAEKPWEEMTILERKQSARKS